LISIHFINQKGSILMKQFTYTITDPVGIHARPAGVLAKQAKALDSTVTIAKADGKSAAATKLMALMGLGIKQGDTVTVTVEGGNEETNAAAMEKFFKDNL
jgi:phosphocarrier protein HPr